MPKLDLHVSFNSTEFCNKRKKVTDKESKYLSTGLGFEEMDVRGRVKEAIFLEFGA